MDPIHREVLDTNHSHLVMSLRANDVMGLLLKDGVINKYDYDQMKRSILDVVLSFLPKERICLRQSWCCLNHVKLLQSLLNSDL